MEPTEPTTPFDAQLEDARLKALDGWSVSRLTRLLEALPEAIVIAEAPSGRLVYGNRKVQRVFRRRFEPGRGMEAYRSVRFFQPSGKELPPERWPIVRSLRHEERIHEEELLVERGDGTRGSVLVSSCALHDSRGRLTHAIAAITDITCLREGEVELERIFHLPNDLLTIASLDGRLLHVNAAWTRTTGWEEHELVGKSVLRLIHPKDLEPGRPVLDRLRGGEAVSRFDFRIQCKWGEYRWFSSSATPIAAENKVYTVSRDVTEEREQREFDRYLTAVVSHDLRGPLQSLAFGLELLSRQYVEDPVLMALLTRLQRATSRASRLVQDLLDFSVARDGRGLQLERSRTSLRALLDEVLEGLPELESRRVVVDAPPRGLEGCWDADRISQVLSNLLRNALLYSPRGSAIGVTLRGDPQRVHCEVQNAGPPIPAELMEHLFDPMKRSSRLGGKQGNIGMGLYIVRLLLEAHRGCVDVRSDPASGTVFHFELPRGTEKNIREVEPRRPTLH